MRLLGETTIQHCRENVNLSLWGRPALACPLSCLWMDRRVELQMLVLNLKVWGIWGLLQVGCSLWLHQCQNHPDSPKASWKVNEWNLGLERPFIAKFKVICSWLVRALSEEGKDLISALCTKQVSPKEKGCLAPWELLGCGLWATEDPECPFPALSPSYQHMTSAGPEDGWLKGRADSEMSGMEWAVPWNSSQNELGCSRMHLVWDVYGVLRCSRMHLG